MTAATTLIQAIEFDWAIAVRCQACGHMSRWGAVDLAERFREQLRATLGDISQRVADHCGQRPVVYLLNGSTMGRWAPDRVSELSDPWTFRDLRLRAFLADHGLPAALADERQAIANALRP